VNVDAALDKKAGKMGFTMCDHEGKFLAAKCVMRMGLWESLAAEAIAAYFGAVFGQEKECCL
jgi:hypothetical protein